MGRVAGPTRLRRVDCRAPGILRRRSGRGFTYIDEQGNRVTDDATLARIEALAIPPAWSDVWICAHANGHIQATGMDVAGRLQYRYHDAWRARRDAEKFDHMLEFARALPMLRDTATEHLQRDDLDQERVLACATRLLDVGFFRIGTEGYAETNQTYGLATMLKRHVRILDDGIVRFDYTAKSGKRRIQHVVDTDVVSVLRALKERRGGGPELLAYRDGRRWVDVKSADINAYIKDVTGGEYTAKDFRTWSASVLAAVALAVSEEARSQAARKRAIARAMSEVAHYLGNTPAVCRASYVDPRVIDRFVAGETVHHVLGQIGDDLTGLAHQGEVEQAVLALLADAPPATLAAAG